VARAIERETYTEMHTQIVFELIRNQLACLREKAFAKRSEDENKRCADASAGQDTQLVEELAGASFPSLEQECRARAATRSLPVLDEELERVNKGLKRLKKATEADDIKKLRVHRRSMMSDLAHVKGIVRAAAVREKWTDEQTSQLIGKVNVKVATMLKNA